MKIIAERSLTNPLNMARDRLRSALAPARGRRCCPPLPGSPRAAASCPVLPSGLLKEHVLQGGSLDAQAAQRIAVRQPGQHHAGLPGGDGQRTPLSVTSSGLAAGPLRQHRGSGNVQLA